MKKLLILLILTLGPLSTSADTVILDTYIDDVQTWTLSGSPYVFQNSAGGDVTIAPSGVLNIEAGVVVRAQNSRKINVYGSLNILGVEGSEVIMTNVNDSAFNASDRWGGIVFNPESIGNVNFLNMRFSGSVQFQPGGTGILNLGGQVSVNDSYFSNNLHNINLRGGVTSVNRTVLDGGSTGILLQDGELYLIDSIITNTQASLNTQSNADKLYARGNQFVNNINNPNINLEVDFDVAESIFNGGKYNNWTLSGSPVGEKVVGPLEGRAVPFNAIITTGNRLVISPGTILKGLYIIARGGEIDIQGTEEEPVILTSIADDSIGGDTNNDGLTTNPTSNRTSGLHAEPGGVVKVSNLEIHYAGALQVLPGPFNHAFSALLNWGGDIDAENLHVRNTHHTGIHHYDGVTNIVNSSVSGTIDRAIVYRQGALEIHNSSFEGMNNYSVFDSSNLGVANLVHNWWGKPEGPKHLVQNPGGTAPIAQGNSLVAPFLSAPPSDEPEINPVIIIPGIMGSELYERTAGIDSFIWPNITSLALSVSDNFLDILTMNNEGVPINQDVYAKNILSNIANSDFFNGLKNALIQSGYEENVSLFFFPYDWRIDINTNSNLLSEKINFIKSTTGSDKIDIIAHSMGGLILKNYLLNDTDDSVEKFIDIATPHLGSPDGFKILTFGDNLGLKYLFGIFNINSQKIKNISQNMPSVYQLLPTREYFNFYSPYVFDLDDLDNNGVRGNLNYDQTKQFMVNTGRNSLLLDIADQFHQEIAGLDPRDYGVETYNIAGCGLETLGKIFVLDKTKADDIEYRIAYIDGDGTVPLKSAENMPANSKYYVKGVQHALMPSASGIKELVTSILTGEDFDISLYPNINETVENCGMPNGRMVSFHSPIELHVYDTNGNHTGPDTNGDIEYGIRGVGYEVIDGNKFAFLPDGIEYFIKGNATDSGSFNARIETIEDEIIVETKYFNDVPLTLETQVEIVSDTILIDGNNDGLIDVEVMPSAVLDENQSADVVKPVTAIMIDGKKKDRIDPFTKPVKVSLIASDDNSGVLKTEYSLDNGVSWIVYIEPFTVANKGGNKVLYKSTDKAGNVELVKSVTITINQPGKK